MYRRLSYVAHSFADVSHFVFFRDTKQVRNQLRILVLDYAKIRTLKTENTPVDWLYVFIQNDSNYE